MNYTGWEDALRVMISQLQTCQNFKIALTFVQNCIHNLNCTLKIYALFCVLYPRKEGKKSPIYFKDMMGSISIKNASHELAKMVALR